MPGWTSKSSLFVTGGTALSDGSRSSRRPALQQIGTYGRSQDRQNALFSDIASADSYRTISSSLQPSPESRNGVDTSAKRVNPRLIGVVGKVRNSAETKKETISVPVDSGKGLFGFKAKAYWESMGVVPLSFAAFGITALAIKLAKIKRGEWTATNGVNRASTHESIVTNEEEEAELHVFKCGGCGYEMYPARGREFKFFPDSFKCPLCATPKSEFWDLNDPTDPRNQEEEEDDTSGDDGPQTNDDSDGDGGGDDKSSAAAPLEPQTQATIFNSDSD